MKTVKATIWDPAEYLKSNDSIHIVENSNRKRLKGFEQTIIIQLSHFRGLHYLADKKIIRNESGKNQRLELSDQNDH
jgi:hypothetical protein